MIESVLATDMANHSKQVSAFSGKIDTLEIRQGENIEKLQADNLNKLFDNQQIILSFALHTADISNPAKPLSIYKKWVSLLFEEFFTQGDIEKEKNLAISILCDRESTSINKAQVGFINFVVQPVFDNLANVLPNISPYIDNIKSNLVYFTDAAKLEDKEKMEIASK